MLQATLGYLNQKHMSSMEDKREGRLYVDNRHARGRSAPVEGTHQEPMVRLHGGVVRLDALDAFDFTVFLLMGIFIVPLYLMTKEPMWIIGGFIRTGREQEQQPPLPGQSSLSKCKNWPRSYHATRDRSEPGEAASRP
jgi:hypothetical protein